MKKEFAKALGDFQQEVPAIFKNTKGYGYSYADLTKILQVINPLMKKHNLAFTQMVDGTSLVTVLIHTESGETFECKMDIPQGVQLKGMNEFQVLGSAITYCRRYQLSAMLGLVTDADIDAAGEQTAPSRPTLSTDRFKAALQAIEKGEYDAVTLKEKYALNNTQLKELSKYE